jgi:tyrosine-protein kinase Etk/Wzc
VVAGSRISNSPALLLSERFVTTLTKLNSDYDHIIIDSPPVLLVTDAVIVGRLSGTTLMVLRSDRHQTREIGDSIKRLRQAGVNLAGVIFNDVPISKKRYGYGKYGYNYSYSYTDKK